MPNRSLDRAYRRTRSSGILGPHVEEFERRPPRSQPTAGPPASSSLSVRARRRAQTSTLSEGCPASSAPLGGAPGARRHDPRPRQARRRWRLAAGTAADAELAAASRAGAATTAAWTPTVGSVGTRTRTASPRTTLRAPAPRVRRSLIPTSTLAAAAARRRSALRWLAVAHGSPGRPAGINALPVSSSPCRRRVEEHRASRPDCGEDLAVCIPRMGARGAHVHRRDARRMDGAHGGGRRTAP